MNLSFLNDKHIKIIGLGKTGIATARFFQSHNFLVSVWDDSIEKREAASAEGFIIDECLNLNAARDIIIWSPGIAHYGSSAHPIALRAKKANVRLISDLDVLCQALPEQDIIAITGTNGKSTTTAMIADTLKNFMDVQMGGNIGAPVLSLEPLSTDGVYVLECSSYQLELTPHLKPKIAILLNITADHLDRHGGMGGYIAAKEKIFTNARKGTEKPIAIIGQDTKPCEEITKKLAATNEWNIIPVSTKTKISKGIWVNEAGNLYDNGEFIIDLNTHEFLKGEHNFENMAACYAALKYGYNIEWHKILEAIFKFKGLPHRQFLVAEKVNVKFINDSKATNADASEKALKSYKNIYWIAGGRAKEGGLSGLEIYKNNITHTALIGESSSSFSKFLSAHNMLHRDCETLQNAVHYLWDLARKDPKESVILLSPAAASWDQFNSFEHRGDEFVNIVNTLTIEDKQEDVA